MCVASLLWKYRRLQARMLSERGGFSRLVGKHSFHNEMCMYIVDGAVCLGTPSSSTPKGATGWWCLRFGTQGCARKILHFRGCTPAPEEQASDTSAVPAVRRARNTAAASSAGARVPLSLQVGTTKDLGTLCFADLKRSHAPPMRNWPGCYGYDSCC